TRVQTTVGRCTTLTDLHREVDELLPERLLDERIVLDGDVTAHLQGGRPDTGNLEGPGRPEHLLDHDITLVVDRRDVRREGDVIQVKRDHRADARNECGIRHYSSLGVRPWVEPELDLIDTQNQTL